MDSCTVSYILSLSRAHYCSKAAVPIPPKLATGLAVDTHVKRHFSQEVAPVK